MTNDEQIRSRLAAYGVDAEQPIDKIAERLAELAVDLGDLYKLVAATNEPTDAYMDGVLADAANVRWAWDPQAVGNAVMR